MWVGEKYGCPGDGPLTALDSLPAGGNPNRDFKFEAIFLSLGSSSLKLYAMGRFPAWARTLVY
jgi:hypothetical protein